MEIYGVKAQMLIGLTAQDDTVMGWISVHYVPGTRVWGDADMAALQAAAARVRSVLQKNNWIDFA